jgi:hypothetical protein
MENLFASIKGETTNICLALLLLLVTFINYLYGRGNTTSSCRYHSLRDKATWYAE